MGREEPWNVEVAHMGRVQNEHLQLPQLSRDGQQQVVGDGTQNMNKTESTNPKRHTLQQVEGDGGEGQAKMASRG